MEQRQVLSVTLGAITGPDANSAFDVPAGKDLYVPLIGTDAGQTISYSATSSDPSVQATVLSGNPTLELTVQGTTAGSVPFSGTMTFQLFENIAPQTVQGIITQVNAGLYNGAEFYRAETSPTFQLIQGGIQPPTGTLPGKSDTTMLPDEFNATATFNSSGLLAMANAGPNTATSEFFVTAPNRPLADDPQVLNLGYTIFGQILTGFDIYNDILNIPTTNSGGINYANAPVTITSASIISDTQNGVLQISEPSNFTGTPTITVTGTGSDATTAQQSFNVNIALPISGSAEAPNLFLSPIANQTTARNTPVTFQLAATESGSSTFTVTGGSTFTGTPANVTVQVTPGSGNTAMITLTPASGFSGTINLLAHADDSGSGLHDAQAFTLTVQSQVSIASVTSPINLTNETSTVAGGTGAAGASISLVASDGANQTAAKQTTVAANGTWNIIGIDVSSLADGTITYTATATDASGTSNNSKTATKDTVAPVVAITSAPTAVNLSKVSNATVSGTGEIGASIALSASDSNTTVNGNTTVGSTGTWSIGGLNLSNLLDGTITYTATATDAAGNPASTTQTVTKDTVAPAVAITSVTNPINLGNASSATASGTGEIGASISLVASDGTNSTTAQTTTVGSGGTWSISTINLSSLKDGTITFTATATDTANNTAQASSTATKATVALTQVSSINASDVNNITASGTGEVGASVSVVASDGTTSTTPQTTTVTSGGTWSVSGINASNLKDGTVTFTATASDTSGKTAQSTQTATKNTVSNASLSGSVFVDINGNGTHDANEPGLQGVIVTLTGINSLASALESHATTTLSDGSYQFTNLPAGTYTITEDQPRQVADGASTAGSLGGTAAQDSISAIVLPASGSGTGYNFSEAGLTSAQISINLFLDSTPPPAQYFSNLASAGVTAPVVMSISKANADPTSAATVNYTVTFNESVTGVDVSDFTVVPSSGVTAASVASVTGSGSSYTVTVNTGAGSGTLGLSLIDDDTIVSALGTSLGGTGGGNGNFVGPVYTINSSPAAVNHAPAGTNNTITTLEDTAHTFTVADFGFTDPNDTPANSLLAVKISTLATAGSLTDNGVTVTAGQSVPVADITGGALKFTPAANANGAAYASFTFQVQDNGGTASGGVDLDPLAKTMTINVTSVNDPPAGADNTVTTLENAAHTFSAGDFGFSDPNDIPANNLLAVRITTLPTAGTLTDNSVAVTVGQSIPVADITANILKFTPATNANGTAYASFTFQVQDDGGIGSGGVDLDPSPNTMTINVTPVNSPPIGTSNTISTTENSAHIFTAAEFGFTDPNDNPPNNLLAVTITTLPNAGTLTDNGVAVTADQSVPVADITSGSLTFSPVTSQTGAPYTSFTFQVQDDGGTANGGVDLDTLAKTMTINVTLPNNPPAGTDNTITTLEDTAHTFAVADFGFTDPSDTPPNNLKAVEITTLPTAGNLTDNGVTVTVGQLVPVADITGSFLTFTPATNGNGMGYASFTFQVQDDGGTADGGVDLDPSPNTMTINVTPINSPPIGTSNTISTTENTAHLFTAAEFGFTDPNDTPPNNLLAVTITTLPTAGTLTDHGLAVTAVQSVPVADITGGFLTFTPAASVTGAPYASFTFQVQDDGGTDNGGVDLDTSAKVMTIDVTAPNHAPLGTSNTISTTENTAHTFSVAEFGFTDPNDTPPNNLLAVTIHTLPGAGTLTDNGVVVTVDQSVSVADIAAHSLVFTPATDATGAPYTSFTFQVQDDGGTADGGADLDPLAKTMTINVTPPNNPPAGTDNTITTLEDTAHTFTVAEFGFTDPNDTPPNNLLAVAITTLPGAGSLTDQGNAVTAGQSVPVADIMGGLLKFTPATNANGAAYASFTFQVQDDGGTADGGADLDQSPNTMTIDVTPVNDPPLGADNTISTTENTAHTFTAGEFGFSDSNDTPPNNLLAVTITTLPTAGTLTDHGVAVTSGQPVPVADITGSFLTFTPAASAVGTPYASFTFQVQDDGGTDNGGVDLDPIAKMMTINVTAPNNAPIGTSNTISTTENTAHAFTVAEFGFTDPNDTPPNNLLAVTIHTLPSAGTLTDNGVAVTVDQSVSVADIAGHSLVFTPATDATGTAYATFTFQVQDDGGTDDGGVDLDPTAKTMTIDVTATSIMAIQLAPSGTAQQQSSNQLVDQALASEDYWT